LLDELLPGVPAHRDPRELATGQQLAIALAGLLARAPRLLLLDEPTRGLDYPTKRRLARMLRRLTDAGHAVVLATHDVELAGVLANRVVMLADGVVISDAPAVEILTNSPDYSTQVAQIMAPAQLLTVDDVRRELLGHGL